MINLEELKVKIPPGEYGLWKIEQFEVKPGDSGALYYMIQGRPVTPGVYTRLVRAGTHDPMMSDTPAEMHDSLTALFQMRKPASERVLINGLGLGMVLQWALDLPNVLHVDVVEIDKDIIDLVGPYYEAQAKLKSKLLRIHCGNALKMEWPSGNKWDVVWSDIWPYISSENLPEMKLLRRKYSRRSSWHGIWCEYQVKRLCGY